MRLSIAAAFAVLAFAPQAGAQTFAPDDVSILLAPPAAAEDPILRVPESSLSAATTADAAKVVARFGKIGDVTVDPEVLGGDRGRLAVAGLRLDPGAPGLGADFVPFGPQPQLRLAVQPVTIDANGAYVQDQAIHVVYTFGTPVPQGAACPLGVIPDLPAFEAAVDDLLALKTKLAAAGVVTDGAPLGVHPAFATEATAEMLVEGLSAFLAKHATEARLSALSVAGIPAGAMEPWMFVAMKRDLATGAITPVPGPAVPQETPPAFSFAQMIDFRDGGEVVPPGLTRNLLPIDCLANFMPIPAPAATDGVTTSTLFAEGANTPEAAAAVAEVVADTKRAHFFNTDCVSCHTETRRQIDAAADPYAASAAIAAAEGIDPEAMPRSPADSDPAFNLWNIRAFGWFPGVMPAGKRAHATVVRRTARETADVVACLNSGRWRVPGQPCLVEAAAIDGAPAAAQDQAAQEPAAEPGADMPTAVAQAETFQGWTPEIRALFYHTSQGSSILPAAYFFALERADGQGKFAAPENLARYGFLASDDAFGLNPRGLPVGMAINKQGDVGLNCAACHTADVVVGGERLRVDGAPATLDFDRFLADLAEAVQATVRFDATQDPPVPTQKFLDFLAAAGEPGDPRRAMAVSAEFLGGAALRHPAYPSGPGRVDALTQIVNSLAVSDLGVPENLRIPAAPTSYPALWLAPQLEFVQWNLSAADPLPRNIGQAQGVFGRTNFASEPPFQTSADLDALLAYEDWLRDLQPPQWPGDIDVALAERGRDLFAGKCEECHNAPPFRMSDPAENARGEAFIKVGAVLRSVVKTDPVYTKALADRFVETGPAAGLFNDRQVVSAGEFFRKVVGTTTAGLLAERDIAQGDALRERPAGHEDCVKQGVVDGSCPYGIPFKGGALKAGPLMGIWATGPYLHNGSVRTVYEVISPPAERAATFWIGDRSVDEARLGFASVKAPGAFLFDTSVPGNGAQGHDFWKDQPLAPYERMAIIEYLKDPARFPVPR